MFFALLMFENVGSNTENHKIKINSDINIENNKNKKFVTRLQPKYYFKFQKSLEHNEHGVISSLIIYKRFCFSLNRLLV